MASRILLADDSITIHKVVNKTFEDEGIEVVAVSRGDLAERQLEEINPDLVLADIFMPGKNGYELCEHIKQSPQFRHIPVVLLVGAFEPFDQTEAQRVKADTHLTKPFEARTLVDTVRRLINSSARQRTGPLPAMNTREEELEKERAAMHTRPIAPPSFNIDLSAMAAPAPQPAEQTEAPNLAAPAAEEPFALDFDYGSFDQSDSVFASIPLDSQQDFQQDFQAGAFGEGALDQAREVKPTADLPPLSDLGAAPLEEFSDMPAPAQSYEEDVFEIADDFQPVFTDTRGAAPAARQGSEIPSTFGNSVQEMMLDFDRLDAPETPAPDNLVSFDTADAFSAGEQGAKTQMLGSPSGSLAGWSIETPDAAPPAESNQIDVKEFSFIDSPGATQSSASLLGVDDPLGDLLQEDGAAGFGGEGAQAFYEEPGAAARNGAGRNNSGHLSQEVAAQQATGAPALPVEADDYFAAGQDAAAQSPLDLSEPLGFAATEGAQEQPAQIDFIPAEPVVAEQPAEQPIEWPATDFGFGSAAEFDHAAEADGAARAEFTASEMWTVEEARFAPIDIEAVPVDEQTAQAPQAEAFQPQAYQAEAFQPSAFESGFEFSAAEPAPAFAEPEAQAHVTAEPVAQDFVSAPSHQAQSATGAAAVELPPAVLDEIVRRVVAEISDSVVREVAWEVVPDCVERVIERLSREELSKRI